MNPLTNQQKQLLIDIKSCIIDGSIHINNPMDEYITDIADEIISLNGYSNQERHLLNGLRELFIAHSNPIAEEPVTDISIVSGDERDGLW